MSPGDSQNLHSSNRNLVLTGFMGTGKTSVGRQVAQRLGRPFVDMDVEIEARTGKSIPRIFAEDGEATFRRIESSLCQELGAQVGLVIATGGGALVDPANRAAVAQHGILWPVTTKSIHEGRQTGTVFEYGQCFTSYVALLLPSQDPRRVSSSS